SKAHPSISTMPGGSVVLGSGALMTDSATLTGGYYDHGTITFQLYAPDGKTIVDTETATVNGPGTYSTPHGYSPTTIGIYQWVATYSGDANNISVVSGFGSEPEDAITATPGTPKTLGFWGNVNGQAILQANDTNTVATHEVQQVTVTGV